MKKSLTILAIAIGFNAYSDNYVSVISSEHQSYSYDTPWYDYGSPYDCSNPVPLESEVYHGEPFLQESTCKQDQKRTKDGKEETQTITKIHKESKIGTLYATSCLEILDMGYSTGNGVYDIEFNGSIFPAYCDMTTDGGGWTNVNTNFGNINAISNNNGITSGGADQLLNGSLVSRSNSNCSDNWVKTDFSQEFFDNYPFNEVKLNAKSYGGGDIRCGGILRHVSKDSVTKFTNFNTGAFYRCDNDQWYGGPGRGFSEERNQNYHHFKYTRVPVDSPERNNLTVFSVSAACSSGTMYMQVQSLMVR